MTFEYLKDGISTARQRKCLCQNTALRFTGYQKVAETESVLLHTVVGEIWILLI